MTTGDQVMPLPSLATQKCKTTYDGPEHPFYYPFLIVVMTSVYGKHHSYRTNDQNKGHHTHKGKRQISVTGPRKSIEDHVGVRPKILRKTVVFGKSPVRGQRVLFFEISFFNVNQHKILYKIQQSGRTAMEVLIKKVINNIKINYPNCSL